MKRALNRVLIVLAAAAALAGGPWAVSQQGPQEAVVRVGEVKTQQVGQRREVTGQVEPARRSSVAAEEAGRVVQAPPEPGLSVKVGQVLARVDDTVLKQDRAAAAALVEEAQAQIDERAAEMEVAQRNLRRLTELKETQVARRTEVEDATSELAARQARVELARAQLRRTQAVLQALDERLARTQVKAPFDAYVVRKGTELGQWLAAGDPVCDLVEISRVKARVYVPQSLVPHIQADQTISLTIDALGRTLDVELFSVIPDADLQTRTFAVLVKIDNADGSIKPGMSVTARVPTGQTAAALTVPRDAVQSTPRGAVVYASRGGLAVMVPVTVRFGEGDRFVVEGDLKDGERVVVEGNERLVPGQPLKIVGDKPAEQSRAEAGP